MKFSKNGHKSKEKKNTFLIFFDLNKTSVSKNSMLALERALEDKLYVNSNLPRSN